MALEEVGARLSLRDRVRFGRDTRGAATDLEKLGDAAEEAGRDLTKAEKRAARAGAVFGRAVGGGINKAAGGLKRFVGFAAKAGPLALAGLAVGGVAAGRSILNLSAQLEATGNKARTVFGDQFGTFDTWAGGAAAKMGLTQRELVGMGAGFADLLVPMGFTRKRASELTQTTLGLSGALSQWSGGTKSAAEVSDILAAAMLGETDSLKSLGIGLSAAEIEAKLLERGQSKLTGAALEQAKAQATLDLILGKSTDAQKAYAAGGNRLLTAQARLSSAWKTAREELSIKVAPFAAEMLERLVRNLPRLQKAAGDFVRSAWPPIREGFRSLGESFGRISEKLGGVTSQEGKAAGMGATIGSLVGKLVEFAGKTAELWITLQIGLARFAADMARTVASLLGKLASVFDALGHLPGGMGKQFRDAADSLRVAQAGAEAFAITLDNLAKPRTAVITVKQVGSGTGRFVDGNLESVRYAGGGRATANATGGRLRPGGLHLVGERGPELIVPQRHGYVLTAQRTAAAMLGAAPALDDEAGAALAGIVVNVGTIVEARDPRNTYAQVRQAVRDELARR